MLTDANVAQQLPSVLVGLLTLLSPYLTALFTRTSMSPRSKQVVAIIVSALIAVVWVALNGGLDSWEKFFVALPVVFGIGQAIYGLVLKDSVKIVEATKGLTDPSVVKDEEIVTAEEEKAAEADTNGPAVEESPAKG
jgi:hypothetical protein